MRSLSVSNLSPVIFGCITMLAMMLVFPDAAAAQKAQPSRLEQFAKLPNWMGVWVPMPAATNAPPVDPVFTAAWVVKRNAHPDKKEVKEAADAVDNVQSQCVWGMPRLIKSMRPFEVTVLPEQTFFSYDVNEFRHVWTDGRKHPLRNVVTNTGHSIGHWDGVTLMIETIGMKPGLWINYKGATLSAKAMVEERWSQPDNDHLKLDVTIRDSLALAKPFVFSRRFQRADTNRLVQQQCFEESHQTTKES